jgi:hypothetical protein
MRGLTLGRKVHERSGRRATASFHWQGAYARFQTMVEVWMVVQVHRILGVQFLSIAAGQLQVPDPV